MVVFSSSLTPPPVVDDDATAFTSLSLDDSTEIVGPEDQEDCFLMDIAEEEDVTDIVDGWPSHDFYGTDDDASSYSFHDCFLSAEMTTKTSSKKESVDTGSQSSEKKSDLKQESVLKKISPTPKNQKCRHNGRRTRSKNSMHQDAKPALEGKPKRPLSAYNIFFRVKRAEVVRESTTNLSFACIGKIIGKAWKNISAEELRKYERISARDMTRYRKQITLWRSLRRSRLRGEDRLATEKKTCSRYPQEAHKASTNLAPEQDCILAQSSSVEWPSKEEQALPVVSLTSSASSEQSQPPRQGTESPAPCAIANFVTYYDYSPPTTPRRPRVFNNPLTRRNTASPQQPQTHNLVSPCHSSSTRTLACAAASPLVDIGTPRTYREGIVGNYDYTRFQPPPPAPPLVSVPNHYYMEPYPHNIKGTRVDAAVVSTSQPYYFSQPSMAHYYYNPQPGTNMIHLPVPYLDGAQRRKYTVSYTCVRMRQSEVQGYIARYYGDSGGDVNAKSATSTASEEALKVDTTSESSLSPP